MIRITASADCFPDTTKKVVFGLTATTAWAVNVE